MKRKEATPLSLPQDSAGIILYLVLGSCTPAFPYFEGSFKSVVIFYSKRSNRQRINLKNTQATPPAQLQKNK